MKSEISRINSNPLYWALVTGASSGIGLCYARQLAHWGWNVILISNQPDALMTVSQTLRNEFDVQIDYRSIDLSKSDAAQQVEVFCGDRNVRVLVNNAGVFKFKLLEHTSMEEVDLFVGLHVTTVLKLSKIFADKMSANGGGYVLNMSSLSAVMSFPGIALYESTKVLVRNFSRALWYENYDRGVVVTAVCPGAVDTELYKLSMPLRKLGVRMGVLMPPERLARKGLRAMFKGRRCVMPGLANKMFKPLVGILPPPVVLWILRKLIRKGICGGSRW